MGGRFVEMGRRVMEGRGSGVELGRGVKSSLEVSGVRGKEELLS